MRQAVAADQRSLMPSGTRIEAQGGRGDDGERALAANQQVAQIVARVVLAQALEAIPDLALGGDGLQAQAQFAGRAVAQHLGASRVGGEVATDGATALGGEAEREEQSRCVGRTLHVRQQAARLNGHGQVGGIDVQDAVEALEVEHDLLAAVVRYRATDQAGVATLGHDADAVAATQANDLGHLVRIGRAHDGQSLAAIALAPVDLMGVQRVFRRGNAHRRSADRLAHGLKQGIELATRGRRRGSHAAASFCSPFLALGGSTRKRMRM